MFSLTNASCYKTLKNREKFVLYLRFLQDLDSEAKFLKINLKSGWILLKFHRGHIEFNF